MVPRVSLAEVPTEGGYPDRQLWKVLANAPKVIRGVGGLAGRLAQRGSLDPRLREVVIAAIAARVQCAYMWSSHSQAARDQGVSEVELDSIRDGRLSPLRPLEALCVSYAFQVESRAVEDGDIETLRANGFTDALIVELTMLAAFYGFIARFVSAMDIKAEGPTDSAAQSLDGSE